MRIAGGHAGSERLAKAITSLPPGQPDNKPVHTAFFWWGWVEVSIHTVSLLKYAGCQQRTQAFNATRFRGIHERPWKTNSLNKMEKHCTNSWKLDPLKRIKAIVCGRTGVVLKLTLDYSL